MSLSRHLYTERESQTGRGATPSVAFLVILNGLIFFALSAVGAHTLAVVFSIPVTGFFMILSAIPQLLVRHGLERRRYLKPLPRAVAYLSPIWILLGLSFAVPAPARPINKRNPAPSFDERYEARFSSPQEGWVVRIKDKSTGKTWRETTDFVPHLNIYWRWDAQNRLWIYNSDDGGVCFYEADDAGDWKRREWGRGTEPESTSPPRVAPPPELYPEYVRARREHGF